MKRTKPTPKRLPDAIRACPESGFFQMRNEAVRDERMSYKAKGVLAALLSNQSGRWISHISTLKRFSSEGETAIRSALKELEEAGYLMRVFYVDRKTKQRRGSFWAYTDYPGQFEIDEHLQFLEENGMEVQGGSFKPKYLNGVVEQESTTPEKPYMGNLNMANLDMGNQSLKIKINKNTNLKNIYLSDPENPNKKSIQEKTIELLPLAERLAGIIRQEKNINITSQKIHSWANEIRKLIKTDGVSQPRIEAALEWYSKNIGGQYVPVIESGASLRQKFVKLEDAMKRSGIAPSFCPGGGQASTENPKHLIRNHFRDSKDLASFFYRDCYIPAKNLFDDGAGKIGITQSLLSLYESIEQRQSKIKPELRRLLPGPISLISKYIAWIEDSDWLTNRNLSMFDINHSLFRRFCREQAKSDNLERDPLTGRSYLGG